MTDIKRLLAQNIKKYRKIRGFTQEALAERAHTSMTYLGTIEIGKKFPSPQKIEQIAEALGVDTPELFSVGNVMFMPSNTKSMERLYQDITHDFHEFEKTVIGRIKELQN